VSFKTISPAYPLILASASPRRKRLLEQIELPFRVVTSHIKEGNVRGSPEDTALELAGRKAEAVYGETTRHWVLGADTLVVIGNSILGKPKDHEEAFHMLRLLEGREHLVMTAFCLLTPVGTPAHDELVTTRVKMKSLTNQEIVGYIATGEPFDKAGAYAIQGRGAFMVEAISGSYTNVVGLPICAVVKALITNGALKSFPSSP
jgi:septum formation protein